jgi:hypothetical protein
MSYQPAPNEVHGSHNDANRTMCALIESGHSELISAASRPHSFTPSILRMVSRVPCCAVMCPVVRNTVSTH